MNRQPTFAVLDEAKLWDAVQDHLTPHLCPSGLVWRGRQLPPLRLQQGPRPLWTLLLVAAESLDDLRTQQETLLPCLRAERCLALYLPLGSEAMTAHSATDEVVAALKVMAGQTAVCTLRLIGDSDDTQWPPFEEAVARLTLQGLDARFTAMEERQRAVLTRHGGMETNLPAIYDALLAWTGFYLGLGLGSDAMEPLQQLHVYVDAVPHDEPEAPLRAERVSAKYTRHHVAQLHLELLRHDATLLVPVLRHIDAFLRGTDNSPSHFAASVEYLCTEVEPLPTVSKEAHSVLGRLLLASCSCPPEEAGTVTLDAEQQDGTWETRAVAAYHHLKQAGHDRIAAGIALVMARRCVQQDQMSVAMCLLDDLLQTPLWDAMRTDTILLRATCYDSVGDFVKANDARADALLTASPETTEMVLNQLHGNDSTIRRLALDVRLVSSTIESVCPTVILLAVRSKYASPLTLYTMRVTLTDAASKEHSLTLPALTLCPGDQHVSFPCHLAAAQYRLTALCAALGPLSMQLELDLAVEAAPLQPQCSITCLPMEPSPFIAGKQGTLLLHLRSLEPVDATLAVQSDLFRLNETVSCHLSSNPTVYPVSIQCTSIEYPVSKVSLTSSLTLAGPTSTVYSKQTRVRVESPVTIAMRSSALQDRLRFWIRLVAVVPCSVEQEELHLPVGASLVHRLHTNKRFQMYKGSVVGLGYEIKGVATDAEAELVLSLIVDGHSVHMRCPILDLRPPEEARRRLSVSGVSLEYTVSPSTPLHVGVPSTVQYAIEIPSLSSSPLVCELEADPDKYLMIGKTKRYIQQSCTWTVLLLPLQSGDLSLPRCCFSEDEKEVDPRRIKAMLPMCTVEPSGKAVLHLDILEGTKNSTVSAVGG